MFLLLRLRDRCVSFLSRFVQPMTSSDDAVQRPSCRVVNASMLTTAFVGGLFVIVALVYASQSPHWILPSVHEPDSHVINEEVSHTSADERGNSVGSAARRVDVGKTSSNMSGSDVKTGRRRSTTGREYVGSWTICAVYDNQLHSCDNVARWVDALLWFAVAMSGTALQLQLLMLLLCCTSLRLLRHQQQVVIGLVAGCCHASAGLIILVAMFIYASSVSDRFGSYSTTSTYQYGRGFVAVVASFLSANASAVFAVYASTRNARLFQQYERTELSDKVDMRAQPMI